MPNVTFFIAADKAPAGEALTRLTAECTELCTSVLKAAREKVHIIYVTVQHGYGHPVFVEVKYRRETFRLPDVMTAFMEALDDAIVRSTGFTARIRCFGYAGSDIQARN